MIINMSCGGANLNFKIVGGTSVPTSPSNNTIWVNTNVEITTWVFSVTEPESPVEGMVWLGTGRTSSVAFNVLKKNTIKVYPVSAKQYISGSWTNVEPKSYMNNEWVSWAIYLFNSGDQCEDITGGWKAVSRNHFHYGAIMPTLTIENGIMTVTSYSDVDSNYYGGTVQTNNKIDMSQYSTLIFQVTDCLDDSNEGHLRVGIASDSITQEYVMDAYKDITSVGEVSVDVSSVNKECVIAINPSTRGFAGQTARIAVDGIYLIS